MPFPSCGGPEGRPLCGHPDAHDGRWQQGTAVRHPPMPGQPEGVRWPRGVARSAAASAPQHPDRAHRAQLNGLEAPKADPVVRGHLTSVDRPLALLHPGSHGSAGNWPPERFAELATRLADAGYSVGLTGTEKRKGSLCPHRPNWPNIVDYGGQFDLTQLMALDQRLPRRGLEHRSTAHRRRPRHALRWPVRPSRPRRMAERWAPLGPSSGCARPVRCADGRWISLSTTSRGLCLNQLPALGRTEKDRQKQHPEGQRHAGLCPNGVLEQNDNQSMVESRQAHGR